jgi:hypothetical protein
MQHDAPHLAIAHQRRKRLFMSKQLALSIAASVLAMSAYVLLGNDSPSSVSSDGPRWSAQANSSDLPGLSQLIPVLQ